MVTDEESTRFFASAQNDTIGSVNDLGALDRGFTSLACAYVIILSYGTALTEEVH